MARKIIEDGVVTGHLYTSRDDIAPHEVMTVHSIRSIGTMLSGSRVNRALINCMRFYRHVLYTSNFAGFSSELCDTFMPCGFTPVCVHMTKNLV